MKNRGYFITGIGTDVGKTYISALLYKELNKFKNTGYLKPIQSGCFLENNKKIAPDVKFVTEFNDESYDESMCVYTLIHELSPHIASEMEEVKINIQEILDKTFIKLNEFETLLVEGAGGVYVPIIRDQFYIYNLIEKLNFPVILVTNTVVGAINNTMLTIEFLKKLNINIHGIIFNNYKENRFEDDNINLILKDSGVKNYLVIKNGDKDIDDKKLREFFKEEIC